MTEKIIKSLIIVFLACTGHGAFAQSGGPFEITQSATGGGGSSSNGGSFAIDAKSGQPTGAGEVRGGFFSVTSGLWSYTPLVPTAAPAVVGGRVTTASGNGIRNVRVTLTSVLGESRTVLTSGFGYYRFEGVAVGQTYIVGVSAKQFVFSRATMLFSLLDNLSDLNFVADPR